MTKEPGKKGVKEERRPGRKEEGKKKGRKTRKEGKNKGSKAQTYTATHIHAYKKNMGLNKKTTTL